MTKRTVALSIDEQTYEKYKKICETNGWVLSKQVENFMLREVNNNSKLGSEKK